MPRARALVAAGFPTQVLAEVGNMLGLRLRELPTEQYNCFVKNEVCRLIVADGQRMGGDKSRARRHNGHHQIRFGLHSFRAPDIPEESQ